MKKLHLLALISIAVGIAMIFSFMGTLTTYDTLKTARRNPGKFLHIIARLDHTKPVVYDPVHNPNFLSFYVTDSLNDMVKVVYRNAKPDNLEASDRLVLKGAIKEDHFECYEIMMKCPSKYKDAAKMEEKHLAYFSKISSPSSLNTSTGNDF